MKLIAYFDENGAGNPYFTQIYHSIFNRLREKYPEHTITHSQPNYQSGNISPSCPGSYSMFTLYNEENMKTIVMSFWDRSMDILNNPVGFGWNKYDIVQIIGGIGMYKNSKEIKEEYGVEQLNYQYPLGVPHSYDYIDQLKSEYNPEKRIRKAVFIGLMYDIRKEFYDYLKNHPLIDIFSADDGYHGKLYFEKMNEYRIALSLNGNGEICMRDFEAMGLSLPVVRAELKTGFHQPLIPNYHYIKATEPSESASMWFPSRSTKELADEYIDAIEKNIDNYEKLITVSNNAYRYYNMHCRPDHIINLYFQLINLEKLI